MVLQRGDVEMAQSLASKVLDSSTIHLGPTHKQTLLAKLTLATIAKHTGNIEQAIHITEEVLRVRDYTDEPHAQMHSQVRLALLYKSNRQYQRALNILSPLLPLYMEQFGAQSPVTIGFKSHLGLLYSDVNRFETAETLLKEVLAFRLRHFGTDHPETMSVQNNLGTLYFKLKRLDDAHAIFISLFNARMNRFGKTHPQTITSAYNLGWFHIQRSEFQLAIPYLEQCLLVYTSEQHWKHHWLQVGLIACNFKAHRKSGKAKTVLLNMIQHLGKEHPQVIKAQTLYKKLLSQVHKN